MRASGESIHELAGEEPAAEQDVIALLGGLQPGDAIGPVEVLAIDAPTDRIVRIDLGTRDAAFSVGVGVAGSSGEKLPPITTDKYELGYGNMRGTGELPPGALRNTAEAIAERVRRVEHRVPTPKGM